MGLTKLAKTLCKSQVALLFTMLKGTRYPQRNRVIALLSILVFAYPLIDVAFEIGTFRRKRWAGREA